MRIKHIKSVALYICMPLLFTACYKDYLSPVPSTSFSESSAFATSDRILNQVRGLYSALRLGAFYGGRYQIYNDIRGEDFINEQTNGVTGLEVWNFTVGNSNNQVTGLWSQAYYVINLCNVFLEGMTSKGNAVVGTTLANNYNAEAKFIRALSYYSLLQLYARPYADGNGSKPGLPIRLKGNTGSGDYSLARSTVAEVYAQVLKDLNEAEAALPLTYSTAADNTTRAHRNTIIALKTRVYLSMQQYANVITEANKIVSATAPFTATTGVAHALQADITNVFKAPYTTTESIFSMPFNTNETPNQNQLGYYYSVSAITTGANGEYSLNNSGIIADAGWKATDKRRNFIYTATSGKKYIGYKFVTASPFTDWAPVIRYSEVLLNLAEAKVRSTNTVDAQAVALLNAVRQRSDATTTFAPATVSDLLAAIATERRIEFIGEGLRSPDIMRLMQTFPGKSTVQSFAPTAKEYVWPISANELLLNKLMTDN